MSSNKQNNNRGDTLIEILIGFGLIALILPAITAIFVLIQQNSVQLQLQTQASYLLNQANEVVRHIRNENWQNIAVDGTYYLQPNGNIFSLTSESAENSQFQIKTEIEAVKRNPDGTISDTAILVDPGIKKITNSIIWGTFRPLEMKNEFYLTRFQNNQNWIQDIQSDWQAGGGINFDSSSSPGSIKISNTNQTTSLANLDFTNNADNWIFSTWDKQSNEADITSSYQASGGQSGGYVDITIPESNNDELGGFWQQTFVINAAQPQAQLGFSYKIFAFENQSQPKTQPLNFKAFLFIDIQPGDPVMGTQVWDSGMINSTSAWITVPAQNIGTKLNNPGTYYLKLAVWLETNNGPKVGPYKIGFDSLNVSGLGNATVSANTATYYSQIFDAGKEVMYGYFDFDTIVHSTSTVKMQIAIANDQVNLNYFGPDGTANSYFEYPQAIPFYLSTGRYLAFVAFLETEDIAVANPQLQKVAVTYAP